MADLARSGHSQKDVIIFFQLKSSKRGHLILREVLNPILILGIEGLKDQQFLEMSRNICLIDEKRFVILDSIVVFHFRI